MTVALAAVAAPRPLFDRVGIFLAFTAALAVTWAYPLLALHREETEALILDEAFLVAMALILPPFEVILALGAGMAIGLLARRRPLLKALFNVGQTLTAAGAALLVMNAIAPLPGPVEGRRLLAVIVGAGVFFALETVAVSIVIGLAEGKSAASVLREGMGSRLLVAAGNVSAGLLTGLAAASYPWAFGIALVPVGVLQLSFAGHLRARRDRGRLQGLFHTALAAHASIGLPEVERAVRAAAIDLLQCTEARIAERPAADGELGAPVPLRQAHRWLLVSGRRGVEPFGPEDAEMLDAIAAIAAAALENATLFATVGAERRKLADVVGSSSDGIFSLDPDGRISSWNPAMEAISGFDGSQMVGHAHLDLLGMRDEDGRELPVESWSTEAPPAPDVRITTADGLIRWLSCTYSPMSDGGWVVVARDVTAQKEMEELKADLLATVSHEIRTPLTPIQGFLASLAADESRFTPEQRQEFYGRMLNQASRLSRLVEELLDAASLQEQVLVVAELDWARAVAGELDDFRSRHPDREFVLEAPFLPLALADPTRASQVLLNLLTNAVTYSYAGAPIRVTLSCQEGEIHTTVADRGPGIAAADRERVFERFTRLGDHLTRPVGGVGLGLYIVRQLTQRMGGRVWVDASPERGAAFTFTMPVASPLGPSAAVGAGTHLAL